MANDQAQGAASKPVPVAEQLQKLQTSKDGRKPPAQASRLLLGPIPWMVEVAAVLSLLVRQLGRFTAPAFADRAGRADPGRGRVRARRWSAIVTLRQADTAVVMPFDFFRLVWVTVIA